MIPVRKWATPLTIGAFFLMAATGILMFFHIDRGIISGAHEWLSWLFLIGVAGHVIANFRSFTNCLKSGWGRTSVSFFGIVFVASFFTWGARTGGQFLAAIQNGLVSVPLTTLAAMTHTKPDVLEQRLVAHGIVARKDQTIRDIAGDSPRKQLRVLEVVFLP
jgi:hypothetical protein